MAKKSALVEPPPIPLADIVNQLRSELVALNQQAQGQPLQFTLESAEVELQVGVTMEAGGKLGFTCWIYQAEGAAKAANTTVQKLKLTLKPRSGGGEGGEVFLLKNEDQQRK